jgi:hypothetical protein
VEADDVSPLPVSCEPVGPVGPFISETGDGAGVDVGAGVAFADSGAFVTSTLGIGELVAGEVR